MSVLTDTLTTQVPEVAFTGDTSGEFLEKGVNEDVFKAKLLIIEMTFVDDAVPVDQARVRGVRRF